MDDSVARLALEMAEATNKLHNMRDADLAALTARQHERPIRKPFVKLKQGDLDFHTKAKRKKKRASDMRGAF
jgi:hypothetical protein